jgi:hypothetical protein
MTINRTVGGEHPALRDAGEVELLEREAEQEGETGGVFNEEEVDELASLLLDVRNEGEFDRLLGGLLSHAAQQVGGKLSVPLGQAVGGLLKSLAKQAVSPPAKIFDISPAPQTKTLGMELEGLDEVEAEFECAKQFVRLAGEAARNALESEEFGIPQHVAEAAVSTAAKVYAPAVPISQASPSVPQRRRETGRWARSGNTIIALDVEPDSAVAATSVRQGGAS